MAGTACRLLVDQSIRGFPTYEKTKNRLLKEGTPGVLILGKKPKA
jgi:hypothetical protein